MRGGEATAARAAHGGDGADAGADRGSVAGDGRDHDVVLGDDALEAPALDARPVALWPWPLGRRERWLQRVVDPLGYGSLLQALPPGDRQFPSDVVRRVCVAAILLAAESQAAGSGAPDAHRLGPRTGPPRGRLPVGVVVVVGSGSLSALRTVAPRA